LVEVFTQVKSEPVLPESSSEANAFLVAILIHRVIVSSFKSVDLVAVLERKHEVLPVPEKVLRDLPLFVANTAELVARLVFKDQDGVCVAIYMIEESIH